MSAGGEDATDAPRIVVDLTEMLLASTGRLRWYGIVRTVAEIASALARLDGRVRFCVILAGHRRFFEVAASVRGEDVTFDVPVGVRQLRVRSVFGSGQPLRVATAWCARRVAGALNRRAWTAAGVALPELDLNGATLVSAARPKLIVEMAAAIDRLGADVDLVPLLYDLIPLHDHFEHRGASFPSNFVADNAALLRRADRLLTISRFRRDEILRFGASGRLPEIAPGAIHPPPLVHECPEGSEPPGPPPPHGPYLLAVGATLGRKNLEAILDALAVLRARGGPVPRLVVAGARRARTEAHLADAARDGIRDLVEMRHAPSQTDLVALYRGALATVLVSRMEGWGPPAVESLWLGTPAIRADIPALREVAGDLGLYVDPDAPEARADGVAWLMTDPDHAGGLRARIRDARPRLRTWTDVARDLCAAVIAGAPDDR